MICLFWESSFFVFFIFSFLFLSGSDLVTFSPSDDFDASFICLEALKSIDKGMFKNFLHIVQSVYFSEEIYSHRSSISLLHVLWVPSIFSKRFLDKVDEKCFSFDFMVECFGRSSNTWG